MNSCIKLVIFAIAVFHMYSTTMTMTMYVLDNFAVLLILIVISFSNKIVIFRRHNLQWVFYKHKFYMNTLRLRF